MLSYFKYLELEINENAVNNEEIKQRLIAMNNYYFEFMTLLKSKLPSKMTKLKVYGLVRSLALYICYA